jgi:hypothetical protein
MRRFVADVRFSIMCRFLGRGWNEEMGQHLSSLYYVAAVDKWL